MKVLLVNGSPRAKGCTYTALAEIAQVLEQEGIETEIFQLGAGAIRDCTACHRCYTEKRENCAFEDDVVNELIRKAGEADGFFFGTPTYYAHPAGQLLSALDRAFFAASEVFAGKPGAAVASARRGGTTATLDAVNKFFTINEMPMVSSTYWNMVHGNTPEEVRQDAEGLQTMRNLGHNMAWLLKCIALGKEQGIVRDKTEHGARTNFIR